MRSLAVAVCLVGMFAERVSGQVLEPRFEVASVKTALKSLLAERFGLRVHVETRQTTVHTLTLARADGRLGSDLKRTSPDCLTSIEERKKAGTSAAPLPAPRELDAPVVDQTGLGGEFDVTLEFESSRRFRGAPPPGPDPNSTDPLPVPLPQALQQRLGLKLEKSTGPLAITVVDAAEHPSPN